MQVMSHTSATALTMAERIFQKYFVKISEALLYPVDVCQLLYSLRCIGEKTLDEVESQEKSTEERKEILLRAIRLAVGFEPNRLKVLAHALSEFEETSRLADQLKSDCVVSYPNDDETDASTHYDYNEAKTKEEIASVVLRCHYFKVSKSIQHLNVVAQILYSKGMIPQATLSGVQSSKRLLSENRAILLKSVRHAVSNDHNKFSVFIEALSECDDCISMASVLKEDYRDMTSKSSFVVGQGESSTNFLAETNGNFGAMKSIFETTFKKMYDETTDAAISFEALQRFFHQYCDHYSPELIEASTTNDIMELIKDRCTLIDINYLEAVINHFNIKKAIPHAKFYQNNVAAFCKYVPVRLCIDKNFLIERTSSPLRTDTVVTFTLNRNPDHCTMEFIRDTISKSFNRLAKNVQLVRIKEKNNFIIVKCFFPNYLTVITRQSLEILQARGMVELTLDGDLLWQTRTEDSVTTGISLEEAVCPLVRQTNEEKLFDLLTESQRKSKRLSIEVKMLRAVMHKRCSRTNSKETEIEETILEDDNDEIELKDAAVQVDILRVRSQKVMIELKKESSEQNVGFLINDEVGPESFDCFEKGIFITKISPGGLAAKDGRLMVGDCIISINGVDMSMASKPDVLTALRNVGNTCSLVIKREEISERPLLQRTQSTIDTLSHQTLIRNSIRRSFKYRPSTPSVAMGFKKCASFPEPLSDAQAVLYNNRVIVGGHRTSQPGNFFEYDPQTDKWISLAMCPVWFFGLTVFQDEITAVGGFDYKTQNCSAKVYTYDRRRNFWRDDRIPSMSIARKHPAVISQVKNIAVAGGQDIQSNLSSVEIFHSPTNQWHTAHSLTRGRSSMQSVLHKGNWYLLGGDMDHCVVSRNIRTNLKTLVNSALQQSGSISRVKTIKSPPCASNDAADHASATVIGQKVLVIGVEYTGAIYALCCEDDPISWIEVGNLPIPLTHTCAVTLSEEEVLVIGGQDEEGRQKKDVYRMYLQKRLVS